MRMKTTNVLPRLFLAVLLALTGCGGGGGGSDSRLDVSANYKGITTQATVTASNAKVLSVDAIEGVQDSSMAGVLGKSVAAPPGNVSSVQHIAVMLEKSIATMHVRPAVAKTVASTVQTTEYGYSGWYSISGDANRATGAISGSITFNAYKEYSYSPTISGTVTFSGAVNTTTGELISVQMTLYNINGMNDSDSQSYTLNGIMGISSNGSTATLSLSIVMLDNTNNYTYWMKDFSMVMTANTMYISGTYYNHNYGYVIVSTLTPITAISYTDTFTAGQLLFTGSNSTKARLTYADAGGYTVEVDANGNNEFVVVP